MKKEKSDWESLPGLISSVLLVFVVVGSGLLWTGRVKTTVTEAPPSTAYPTYNLAYVVEKPTVTPTVAPPTESPEAPGLAATLSPEAHDLLEAIVIDASRMATIREDCVMAETTLKLPGNYPQTPTPEIVVETIWKDESGSFCGGSMTLFYPDPADVYQMWKFVSGTVPFSNPRVNDRFDSVVASASALDENCGPKICDAEIAVADHHTVIYIVMLDNNIDQAKQAASKYYNEFIELISSKLGQ